MQSSSASPNQCTQVPIKVQHRIAKKKITRRRRIDLPCGCSYFSSLNCANHGFTHRGTHHCHSGREWRFYLGDNKSPVFQDNGTTKQALPVEQRHSEGQDPIQLQPEESTGDAPMFSGLPDMDELTPSDWSFLKSI
ncbi:AC2 protein [Tomato leaf curl China virus - OX2]|uniref:Transcriptional activator protein n=1 Tax=Tomato leaf curl China virus TaxID=229636 RepID=A0A144I6K6_9GEMI|nr:AC2 protein [Tomato leaf curl China virus - OX2]AMT74388.1 AC2 protein [Tomato leaf curl China virus]AGK90096.1 AC2 protein [Tomato leaf curl China virus - OX2]AMT74394.1 AC2 protein [Tomato leaf curl China virus]AMT74400.1 AC2 protein [Tomato leaf curl China virus]AMT74406.1 AC2 protein [Tomato leaf curl China virus]